MSFFGGIRKIFEGLDESVEAASDVLPNALSKYKTKRRKKLSGKYTIRISLLSNDKFPILVAQVTYNGLRDTHDIDLITSPGSDIDVWERISNSERFQVNWQINGYFQNLKKKAFAKTY